MAAVRSGDTLVVAKLDRLARSVPDARARGDDLAARGTKLQIGASVHDPSDPMGRLFFSILATFAEFEADLIKCEPVRGWRSRDKGNGGAKINIIGSAAEGAAARARRRRVFDQRS